MKKVVFFTENKWAFGSIHHGLSRLLYKQGINAELLDFFTQYQPQEMQAIDRCTDCYVTTPPGAHWLIQYGVDPGKILAVAHAQWDILLAQRQMNLNFDSLGGYGVVSEILLEKSQEFGISRKPQLLTLGIFFDRFYSTPAVKLNTCGYAAAMSSYNFFGEEIKRVHLVKSACAGISIPLTVAQGWHFLSMPHFYQSVDCVLMSSLEEGAGLPALEAAAAGRLVMGTPVGYFAQHTQPGCCGGIAISRDPLKYVQEVQQRLAFYQQDSVAFARKCQEIQEYARYHYDWSYHVDAWQEFISNH